MRELERFAVLAHLTDRLNAHGSWCGETHVQKSVYFLQELFAMPTAFPFILYKHGPFSFDLRDELTGMRADGFLQLIPQHPYGASHKTTDLGENLERRFSPTIKEYSEPIEYVSRNLGSKKVADLEQLATALYVMKQEPQSALERWSELLNQLKPHVSIAEAKSALETMMRIREEVNRC